MRIRSIVLATALIAACKPAGETPEQAAARMQATTDSLTTFVNAGARRWEASMVAGTMDSIAAMYASNAIVMPPNMAMVRGRDDIKTLFTNLRNAAPPTAFTVTPQSIAASGDIGSESGMWKFSGTANNRTVADSGSYLIHWHRNGSGWEVAEHIWNSSNPPMPAAPARR